MRTQIYSKTNLISLYKDLALRLGKQPTEKHWREDVNTPSDMPIRCNFGTWNNFVIKCGGKPQKPYLSELAKLNSIKAHKGKRSYHWKGGRIKDKWGYVYIWIPEHPNAKGAGYIKEHRLVMSKHLKRPLTNQESVHHKNGIKDDNRLSNLELMTKHTHKGQMTCPYCRKEFIIQ